MSNAAVFSIIFPNQDDKKVLRTFRGRISGLFIQSTGFVQDPGSLSSKTLPGVAPFGTPPPLWRPRRCDRQFSVRWIIFVEDPCPQKYDIVSNVQ
jgi:hypothetical protein